MNDNDLMPFGKYKDRLLSKVPEQYFRWLVKQEWLEHWPLIVVYCEQRLGVGFNPVRKPRKCVLATYTTVTGEFYDPAADDGTCPFGAD